MASKASKVFLESAGLDIDEGRGRLLYRVTRLVNTVEPRVGQMVSESFAARLIREGVDVTIVPGDDEDEYYSR